jgi:hypothetical protein
MTSISETDIKKGQAIYTPILLKIYNVWVLDISNKWIWRCSKRIQLEQFNKYITENHLDIGVGTGYYLEQCQRPLQLKLSLMDLNPNCLNTTKALLHDCCPDIYLADIFKPQPSLSKKFSSISMNYLLHCLPGNMEVKAEAIFNAVSMLMPGGILFGATILADDQLHTKISQRLCAFYNKEGIFSNRQDTLKSLQSALAKYLTDVEISVVGCVALFRGKRFE